MICRVVILGGGTGGTLTAMPGETEGLTGPGWMENVFTFYTPEGSSALGAALTTFDGGRVVVNVVDMPIKCPVAPLEFCFLAGQRPYDPPGAERKDPR